MGESRRDKKNIPVSINLTDPDAKEEAVISSSSARDSGERSDPTPHPIFYDYTVASIDTNDTKKDSKKIESNLRQLDGKELIKIQRLAIEEQATQMKK